MGKGCHTPASPLSHFPLQTATTNCLAGDRTIRGGRYTGERTGAHQLSSIRGLLKC